MVYYCDAAECESRSSKAKKRHIYSFVANVMWVKWLRAQKRWKELIQRERKDKMEKNVDVLNLTRNSRLCSCHFNKEKIIIDGSTSDPEGNQ